jgi:hypothetical protein
MLGTRTSRCAADIKRRFPHGRALRAQIDACAARKRRDQPSTGSPILASLTSPRRSVQCDASIISRSCSLPPPFGGALGHRSTGGDSRARFHRVDSRGDAARSEVPRRSIRSRSRKVERFTIDSACSPAFFRSPAIDALRISSEIAIREPRTRGTRRTRGRVDSRRWTESRSRAHGSALQSLPLTRATRATVLRAGTSSTALPNRTRCEPAQ